MSDRKTLIINYAGLGIGGVEQYLNELMQAAMDAGHRVVWLTSEQNFSAAKYRKTADDPRLEKVFGGKYDFFLNRHPHVSLKEDEDAVMVSFSQEAYIWGEYYRIQNKCHSFFHYFILMNFFGDSISPEDKFKSKLAHSIRARMSYNIAHRLEKRDLIRAFALRQLSAYNERYSVQLEVSKKNLLAPAKERKLLTDEEIRKKAAERINEFRIVACSRFDFPHKGFLVGLLDEFVPVKENYPQADLTIVGGEKDGDGDSELVMQEKYRKLPEKVRDSIKFVGTILPDELEELYRNCHLSIALAGAATKSASMGVPTIITRHNSYSCEAYGFYQDAKSSLRDDPGLPIFDFIKKAICCTDDEYLELSKADAKVFQNLDSADPLYIMNEKVKSSEPVVNRGEMILNSAMATCYRIIKKLKSKIEK